LATYLLECKKDKGYEALLFSTHASILGGRRRPTDSRSTMYSFNWGTTFVISYSLENNNVILLNIKYNYYFHVQNLKNSRQILLAYKLFHFYTSH
jgi:hypothetical protein